MAQPKCSSKSVDKRVVERYVAKGQISESEYQAHLKSLPDDENNAQWVQVDLDGAEYNHSRLNDSDEEIVEDEDDSEEDV